MPTKTPEEIAADEAAASKEQREQLAREANKKRNEQMLEQRNAIADSADTIKTDEDDLVPLTDDIWDQSDRPDQVRKKSRAELIAEQEEAEERERLDAAGGNEDEAAAALIRKQEALDRDLDDARDAGADDSRKNADGVVEYRVEINGDVKWLTLKALREQAGSSSETSDTRQRRKEGDTTQPTRTPSPEALQAQRQAEAEVKAAREARKAKLKDLYLKASMGDEEAIDSLADMQAEDSRVTPEVLNRMVDERVDARVEGKTAFDRAVDWFESDDGYRRELAAPGFKTKAGQIDKRMASEHPELTPRQRLDLVGKELRKELAEMRKFLGAKPDDGARREEPKSKLDRKREASGDEVPRAAGRARAEQEPDEVQTAAEAIQSLARSRGQQRPITHKH